MFLCCVIITILCLDTIPVTATTNLSTEQELKLVFIINGNISKARAMNKKLGRMLIEDLFKFEFDMNLDQQPKIEVKYTMMTSTARERMKLFIRELFDDDDIDVLHFTNAHSIVIWFRCGTRRATEKLNRMIKSGELQKFLGVLFTVLLDRSEDVKVVVNENDEAFRRVNDFIKHHSGIFEF